MKIKQCVVTLALVGALTMPAFAFNDIYDESLSVDVATLESMDIVTGYEDDTFRPDNNVTRAEFCAFLVRLMDDVTTSNFGQSFTDVTASHWAYSNVQIAYELGILQGNGDGTFAPDRNVTVAEAVTATLRVLGYTSSDIGYFWPNDYMNYATSLGLLDEIEKDYNDEMTRADVVNLLVASIKLSDTNLLDKYDNAIDDLIPIEMPEEDELTIYNGTNYVTYTLEDDFPEELLMYGSGTMLFNSGEVAGFVPDGNTVATVSISGVDADGLTLADGTAFDLESDVSILFSDEILSYGTAYYRLVTSNSVKVFYDTYGQVSWIMPNTYDYMDGYVITGVYEEGSPNLSKPETVTVAGASFDVSSDISVSFSGVTIGDVVHIFLDEDGEITSVAEYDSALEDDMIGTLSGDEVTLTCGIVLSGDVSAINYADNELVKVTQTTYGELIITRARNSTKNDWDLTTGTLGSYDLAPGVQIYDCVNKTTALELTLDEILVDSVAASQILYYHLNGDSQVDILLLNDVTGNCYTYGYVVTSTVSGSNSGMTYTNNVWAVENSDGISQYLTSNVDTTMKGELAGLVASYENTTEAVVYLSSTGEISRDSFTDTSYVGGFPIAEDVQVYSEITESWVSLDYALATSSTLEAFYDREISEGGQIRVIVAY